MDRAHLISIGLPLVTSSAPQVEPAEQRHTLEGFPDCICAPPEVDVRGTVATELTLLLLLAQSRPQAVCEAVEKAAVAVSRRQGAWGVDGVWSYDFSRLGYACSATSHSGAKPELGNSAIDDYDACRDSHSSCAKRCDILKTSFARVIRSRGGRDSFRVLDLGAGSGGWLLQARRDLEEQLGKLPAIQLHGVTGDALPSEVRAMKPSRVTKRDAVEVAHFQQVGIEMFPLRLGSDNCVVEEQRAHFTRTVETALTGVRGYDLIVSSWTFCHLVDPLATLEIWSNALAVQGELYVNDIDFSVLFDGESINNGAVFWESDPEKRMAYVFEALNAKGKESQAFSIDFVYDEEKYRTAVKVERLSVAPIRFAPVVEYSYKDDRDDAAPLLDNGGRPVYHLTGLINRS